MKCNLIDNYVFLWHRIDLFMLFAKWAKRHHGQDYFVELSVGYLTVKFYSLSLLWKIVRSKCSDELGFSSSWDRLAKLEEHKKHKQVSAGSKERLHWKQDILCYRKSVVLIILAAFFMNYYAEDCARRVENCKQEEESHVEQSQLLVRLDVRQTQALNEPVDVSHCKIVDPSHRPNSEEEIYLIENLAHLLVY